MEWQPIETAPKLGPDRGEQHSPDWQGIRLSAGVDRRSRGQMSDEPQAYMSDKRFKDFTDEEVAAEFYVRRAAANERQRAKRLMDEIEKHTDDRVMQDRSLWNDPGLQS